MIEINSTCDFLPLKDVKVMFYSKSQGWHIGYYEDKTELCDGYFYEHQENIAFSDVTDWSDLPDMD
ncbi:MAG: hypothetical protein RSC05_13220 [Acinetobacter sp.]